MYRIFTSVPIVWVGESTVQIGADEPVYLEGLSVADVELVNCLRLGVPAHDFAGRAERCGVTPGRAVKLLGLLEEAGALDPSGGAGGTHSSYDAFARASGLRPDAVANAIAGTRVALSGPLRDAAAHALRSCGFSTRAMETADSPRGGEVLVLTAVLAPDLLGAGQAFDADVRHMHFVLGESSATVGHLIQPGITPCSGCAVARAVREDDAWFEAWRSLRGARWGSDRMDAALLALGAAHLAVRLRIALTAETVPAGVRVALPDGAAEEVPAEFDAECTCRVPLTGAIAV